MTSSLDALQKEDPAERGPRCCADEVHPAWQTEIEDGGGKEQKADPDREVDRCLGPFVAKDDVCDEREGDGQKNDDRGGKASW